jgi:HEAT repeat protein
MSGGSQPAENNPVGGTPNPCMGAIAKTVRQARHALLMLFINDGMSEHAPNPQPPVLIHGLALDDWNERLKSVVPGHPEAAALTPLLAAVIADESAPETLRQQAAYAAARMGDAAPDAARALVELVRTQRAAAETQRNVSLRLWATKACGRFGATASAALPILVDQVRDPVESADLRAVSLASLQGFALTSTHALEQLISVAAGELPENDPRRRDLQLIAVELLGGQQSAASTAVPALVRLLDDPAAVVRLMAVESLGLIGPSANPATPRLLELLLADDEESVRSAAVIALGRLGPGVISDVSPLLSSELEEHRFHAAACLATVSPPVFDAELISILRAGLDDPSARVQAAYAAALCRTANAHRTTAFESLVDSLNSEESDARMSARVALIAHGRGVDVVQQRLAALLGGERDDRTRRAASEARRIIAAWSKPATLPSR